ncbi:MAG: head-tail adaptor protein [Rhizobiaceae bacterium]
MIATIAPGSFRHKLEIQQRLLAADGFGGRSESWVHHKFVWALVEPRESFRVGEGLSLVSGATHVVTIREDRSLPLQFRFVLAGRIFQVLHGHDPDETGRYRACQCREFATGDDAP